MKETLRYRSTPDHVKFTSIEWATYCTGHLGCGNPNSFLLVCDDNRENNAKPLNLDFLRSTSNCPGKERGFLGGSPGRRPF